MAGLHGDKGAAAGGAGFAGGGERALDRGAVGGRRHDARDELDRAMKAQPRDAAAQDLLAKLYFRLGVYPRAIELYTETKNVFIDLS